MTTNQNDQPEERKNPGRFISTEEALASVEKWIELNDELFRRLAESEKRDRLVTSDNRFSQVVKEVTRKYARTMKRLADGDKA